MSFSINTNVASLQAQSYLRASSDFQSKTISRVTSGLRIVQSGDDAAGLAIANGYRSDEAVLTQGIRNANDGLSQLQIADGGLNNISQLIDRARTLATQSASGTFTGDRNVLNSEFQSVVSEINRQAQSIGLNQGGAFAKSLSVFIGGGKGSSSTDTAGEIANGSVSLDLSKATVDAKSLGLTGVQAEGKTSVDLSAGQATSVQNILGDTANKASEAQNGYTTFTFQGAGFSDANKIAVSVNLSGVTDTTTLTTALNAALQNAGNGSTAAATAFKNAGITATVATDPSGAQHLQFTSGNGAFEVQAGDLTANALLGNTTAPGSTTGNSLNNTFTGSSNLTVATKATQATTIKLQFEGAGQSSPTTISVAVAAGDTVATVLNNLATAVSGSQSLASAGITLGQHANGQPLTFQSTNGQAFSVAAGGDVENLLGLGSARLGAASAFDYTTTTGTAYSPSASTGTANFEFSFNGAASSTNALTVNLSQGDATAGAITGTNAAGTVDTSANKKLDISIDGVVHNIVLGTSVATASGATASKGDIAVDITNQLAGAGTASVDTSGHLIITSATKGTSSSVQILTAAATDAGATLGLTGSSVGQSRSGADLANNLNQQIAANSTLQNAGLQASFAAGKITIASQNNSFFQLNAFGSGAVGGTVVGADAGNHAGGTGTFDVTAGTNDTLNFKVDGVAQTITLTAQTNKTAAQIATDINAQLTAGTITGVTASSSNGHLILTSTAGSSHSIQVTGGNANGILGFSTTAVNGEDANAGFGVAGASFTGNTQAAPPTHSPNLVSQGSYQTTGYTFSALASGADSQTVNINAEDANGGTHTTNVVLTNNLTGRSGRSIDEAVSAINAQLQKSNDPSLQSITAVKYNDAGTEKIQFVSANTKFSVSAGNTATSTGLNNGGQTVTAAVSGTGSTADISNQASAQNAVAALSSAVTALGSAQAVVGRGENSFTYAVNLAQSQLTNTTTAESRIRDADLATEAANLTKAQVLLQAGVAALAQANSAPQNILSLLKG